jgi:hypothetical protein
MNSFAEVLEQQIEELIDEKLEERTADLVQKVKDDLDIAIDKAVFDSMQNVDIENEVDKEIESQLPDAVSEEIERQLRDNDIESEVGKEIERQLPDAVSEEIERQLHDDNSDIMESIKVIVEQLVQEKFKKLIEKSREV